VFRWYVETRERVAVRARAETVALQGFARELLAMRDLANTPLQHHVEVAKQDVHLHSVHREPCAPLS
jgi:hypothetical protein